MNIPTIGTNNHGEKAYRIYLGTGTARVEKFDVYAYNETEAVDLVADYCEEHEMHGVYADYYELADLCEGGETVDEYAECHGLICCGNHGIYLDVLAMAICAEDEEFVVRCLIACYRELLNKLSDEDKEGKQFDIEDTIFNLENFDEGEEVDDYLECFYDLCDELRAWIET